MSDLSPGEKIKFRVLACTTDETDLDTELRSESSQDFEHVTLVKEPVFL